MTTLSASSQIASSSLSAIQVQLSVTSSNIANADTEGYTRKEASTTAEKYVGGSSGVSVGAIQSGVNRLLTKQLTSATSETAAAQKTADYLDSLQSALGVTTSSDDTGVSLASKIADLETSVSDLLGTPESTSLAYATLSSLDTVTSELNTLSTKVQALREDADSEIESSVRSANIAIVEIDRLNDQILEAKAQGQSTANLEDQRSTALVSLSESLGVTSFESSNGTMKVYTTSGQVLVGADAHTLEFDNSSTINAGKTYNGPDSNSGLSGISVDGTDITDSINTGAIGGLLELRDETLPASQDMIDELATSLITSLNAVIPDLLTGSDSSDIAVNEDLLANPETLLDIGRPEETVKSMLDALQGDTDFDEAGKLGARTTDFASYASDILSQIVSETNMASSDLEQTQTELRTITDTISSSYGVNVDEEVTRMSELEQLYSVSSQILSIIQEMFDDLLAAVR
ncbi:flagellar hook-associated protein FlgK [Roseibium algae]|uniref:Flagellar hook-associated protein 1 n=1 Tax=Roseibium algae TaxID=3123038 RepID=A0ABU8TFR9_9HYPH